MVWFKTKLYTFLWHIIKFWHHWYIWSVIIETSNPPDFYHPQSVSDNSQPIPFTTCKCTREEWYLTKFSFGGNLEISRWIVVSNLQPLIGFWDVACFEMTNHQALLFKQLIYFNYRNFLESTHSRNSLFLGIIKTENFTYINFRRSWNLT